MTLSKNMEGQAPFWTKGKYGKMCIEGSDSVYTQAPHHGEAGAIHQGKVLVTPGNTNIPSNL